MVKTKQKVGGGSDRSGCHGERERREADNKVQSFTWNRQVPSRPTLTLFNHLPLDEIVCNKDCLLPANDCYCMHSLV